MVIGLHFRGGIMDKHKEERLTFTMSDLFKGLELSEVKVKKQEPTETELDDIKTEKVETSAETVGLERKSDPINKVRIPSIYGKMFGGLKKISNPITLKKK